ncbi:MAG: GNAT family N-acetyltransferase [Planctomycetes bacterium]|nr:GNAT family N-acetyltransferase [Planctomycetota bacterium]
MNHSVETPILETERLILRGWSDDDLAPFAQMNADPNVMRHFPTTLSREESDHFASRIIAHFSSEGFGLWAVEIKSVAPFVGFIGLATTRFEAHFTPNVEIGWRLAADCWGNGYAPEGARAALKFGFKSLDEIVSFTVPANLASRRVMEKIGMTHDPTEDFEHPALPERDPLRRHVLYRLRREDWETNHAPKR